jgi:DNA invertase Pin-like site-specific DNA recombinase
LIIHVFGALAEFERSIIRERTVAGLVAAKARGRVGGRPRVITKETAAALRALLDQDVLTVSQIATQLGISEATIYKHYKHFPRPKSERAGRATYDGVPDGEE